MIWLWLASCVPSAPIAAGDVVVVYGARGEGEIEPCGCPKRPLGGLARRNTVVDRERAAGADLVVDGGGSLGGPVHDDLGQRRQKAALVAHAFKLGAIDALALGEDDWALGSRFVRDLVRNEELPVLAANLTCDGVAFPGGRTFHTDHGTVGVVGVTTGEVEGCVVGEPREALARAVRELGKVDVVLALLPFAQDRTLRPVLEEGLDIDLAIDARGRATLVPPERIGKTWLVGSGTGARSVSVLTLHLDPARSGWAPGGLAERVAEKRDSASVRVTTLETRLQDTRLDAPTRKRLQDQHDGYVKRVEELGAELTSLAGATTRVFETRAVDLDAAIPDHAATASAVADTKHAITLAAAGGANPATFVPRAVAEGPYLGGEGCVACHTEEHAQWSQTPHARAWRTLVDADRALDTACWSCHVTGAGRDGGPPAAARSGPWRDVQCEACHGPSRAHAASPTTVDSVRVPPLETCTPCHDGVRDEGRFDPPTYVPRIDHHAALR